MKSKQRWYQCWERLHNPDKRPITLYRQYHRMDPSIKNATALRSEWLQGYEERGIDMRTVPTESVYYWDEKVFRWLHTHGTAPFRRLNIWDRNWTEVGQSLGYRINGTLSDPRSSVEKHVHGWLARTQRQSQSLPVRALQKLLQIGGW
jgi:hypothetical protein